MGRWVIKLGAKGSPGGPPPWERHRNPGVYLGGRVPHTATNFFADPNSTILGQGCKEKNSKEVGN